jgi:RNA polymerase sigma-70 factor (ECF subfamily)
MSHFDAAYSLARWLTKDPVDADDVVQEALLRAFTYFETFHGTDGRAWLLSIVRNTSYTWLRKNRSQETMTEFDENLHSHFHKQTDPELQHIQKVESGKLRECIEQLPLQFREVLVLRDIEDLSYKAIADITGLPMGTVMSRLSRARHRVQECVAGSMKQEP